MYEVLYIGTMIFFVLGVVGCFGIGYFVTQKPGIT